MLVLVVLVRSKCNTATRVYYIMHTTYNTIVQVHAFTYQAGKQAFRARQQSAQNILNAKSKLSNLMSLGLWSFYKVSLLGVDSLLEIARLFLPIGDHSSIFVLICSF